MEQASVLIIYKSLWALKTIMFLESAQSLHDQYHISQRSM